MVSSFAPAAAATGFAFYRMIEGARDFEKEARRAAVLTQGSYDDVSKAILDMAKNSVYTTAEVAAAFAELGAKGFDAAQATEALPGILSAAAASGEDLGLVADTITSALNSFRLEASESSRVADVLAQAANQSAAGVLDMQYAFKYAAGPAAQLGYEIEDLAAAVGIMVDAGLSGEQAGTTLRAALLRLVDPPKEAKRQLDQLGVSIRDRNGEMKPLSQIVGELIKGMDGMTNAQKAAALATIFGTEAVSGMMSLISAGPEEIEKMTRALENSAGASQKAADAMLEGWAGALTKMESSIDSASKDFVNSLAPTIERVANLIEYMANKFMSLSPTTKSMIATIAAVVTALLALGTTLGIVVSSIGGAILVSSKLFRMFKQGSDTVNKSKSIFSSFGKTVGSSTSQLNLFSKSAGLLLGPFRLLGSLFMMFLPQIVRFIARNEEARQAISNAWNSIVQAIQPVFVQIMNAFQQLQPVFQQIGSSLGAVFASLVRTATSLLSSIGPSLSGLASSLGAVFTSVVQAGGSLLTALTPVFQGVLSLISSVFVALQPVFDQFSMMFAELAPQFQQTGAVLAQSFQQLAPAFAQLGQALVELGLTIGQVLGQLAQGIISISVQLLPQLANTFASILPVILQVVMSVIPVITQLIQAIIPIVLQIVTSVLPVLLQVVQAVFPVILQVIQQVIPIVLQVLLSIVPVILQIAKAVIPLILQAVQMVFPVILQIIQAVIPIIITVLKLAATFIRTVLVPAIQFILEIVQIVFPAILKIIQNAIQIITNIIKLFTAILKGDWKGAWDAIKNITSSVWNTIKTIISTAINVVKTIVQNVWNTIKTVTSTVWNGIKATISNVWDGIKSTISNVVNGIRSTISNVFESIKSTATTVWNGIKSAMIKPVEAARDAIKTAIDKIKGFFSGLKLKIPKIQLPKLPRFSIEGKFSLTPPSVPKIKVSWNAKGGIFKEPTIFNTANAGLQGVGEAGPEAIIPLTDTVLGKIGAMIAKTAEFQNNLSAALANSNPADRAVYIEIGASDVYLDGRKVGEVIWQPVKENIDFYTGRGKKFRG
ncbi:phage tail tape measure protein [Parageobacillus thermantarcticus]